MQININNNVRWHDRPFGRWLAAVAMAGTLWALSNVVPYPIAVVMAIVVRAIITGAVHERGLCKFLDGFGEGGNDRNRILSEMKDNRIGVYGALGIVAYAALLFLSLYSMRVELAVLTIIVADPFARMVSSQLAMMLPYVGGGNYQAFARMDIRTGVWITLQGLLPIVPFAYFAGFAYADWRLMLFVPCLLMYFLYLYIMRHLRAQTSECTSAIFLLVELSIYLMMRVGI